MHLIHIRLHHNGRGVELNAILDSMLVYLHDVLVAVSR